jgi:hypothetical protein
MAAEQGGKVEWAASKLGRAASKQASKPVQVQAASKPDAVWQTGMAAAHMVWG